MSVILKSVAVAAVCSTLALSGPALAQPSSAPARQCFFSRDIDNFQVVDDHTIYLKVLMNRVFRLDLTGGCSNLSFRQRIGFETTPAGSTICSPLDLEVVYNDNGFPQRCAVKELHALTPGEIAALPKKERPERQIANPRSR